MTLNGRTILVVAGGYNIECIGGYLNSVEILDPSGNNVWTPGLYLFITEEFCLINIFQ